MTADAFSDAVLCLCALWLMRANGRQQQAGLGLACGVIGVAAMLGVLRFSNWTAASQAVAGTHQFLSLLGAVGAFPLLAYALAYPHSPLARRFSGAFWMMFSVGGLGLAVVKKIADEHRARLELKNLEADGQVSGAQVSLSFQTVASMDKG